LVLLRLEQPHDAALPLQLLLRSLGIGRIVEGWDAGRARAGTPFGVTVDFETLGEKDAALRDTVTLRDRDSMKQERVNISDLLELLSVRIA